MFFFLTCTLSLNLWWSGPGPGSLQSGAKIIDTSYSLPFPPQRQRQWRYHDTKLQCWLKTFTQHCRWGEGGNSKKRSNYMNVDVSTEMKKKFEIRKVSLFLHVIVARQGEWWSAGFRRFSLIAWASSFGCTALQAWTCNCSHWIFEWQVVSLWRIWLNFMR
jgi:hypothetical protein